MKMRRTWTTTVVVALLVAALVTPAVAEPGDDFNASGQVTTATWINTIFVHGIDTGTRVYVDKVTARAQYRPGCVAAGWRTMTYFINSTVIEQRTGFPVCSGGKTTYWSQVTSGGPFDELPGSFGFGVRFSELTANTTGVKSTVVLAPTG